MLIDGVTAISASASYGHTSDPALAKQIEAASPRSGRIYRAPKGVRNASTERPHGREHIALRACRSNGALRKPAWKFDTTSYDAVQFYPTSPQPDIMNGLRLAPVEDKLFRDGWAAVANQNSHLGEPETPLLDPDTRLCSALLVTIDRPGGRPPDDRYVLLMKPTYQFDGVDATYPGGGVDKGLTPRASAIKETYEETGFLCEALEHVTDEYRLPSRTGYKNELIRYYRGRILEGTPASQGPEGWGVAFVSPGFLLKYLNKEADQRIAHQYLGAPQASGDWPPPPVRVVGRNDPTSLLDS